MVKGTLLGALVQLGCKSFTEVEEEGIWTSKGASKGLHKLHSLSMGEGKLLCLRQSSIRF